jgi:hypothetical protein
VTTDFEIVVPNHSSLTVNPLFFEHSTRTQHGSQHPKKTPSTNKDETLTRDTEGAMCRRFIERKHPRVVCLRGKMLTSRVRSTKELHCKSPGNCRLPWYNAVLVSKTTHSLEALFMRHLHRRRRRRRRHYVLPRDQGALYQYIAKLWSLDDWDDSNTVQRTRFTKHQIRVLVVALKIDAIEWSCGIRPDTIIALLATLCRLLWPRPLADLADTFGYCSSYPSRVVNDVCQHLIEQHQDRLL